MAADISVAVVNYNSSHLLAGFLESLFGEPVLVQGRALTLEVVVVDNASRPEERRRLETIRDPRVRVVLNDENTGYAAANNQAFAIGSGRWHVVSNPDVIVGPGCLAALIDAIETLDGAAIVGPLASMDREGAMLMPPNELPDPWLETVEAIARHEPAVARWRSRRQSCFRHRYWTATRPIPLPGLSGCFFLGRRTTFEEHGLFDPGYPLYYEDLDLFRRYRDLGLGLWHVPAARIVHFWSKSAETDAAAARERNRSGAERYFRKWFGESGARTLRAARGRAEARERDDRAPFDALDLGPRTESPEFALPPEGRGFFELSANARFSFAVGILPTGRTWTPPASFWNDLPPVRLWCRAVAPSDGATLRAWTFRRG